LPQVVQMRLRTASVDSKKLVWVVSSACSCALEFVFLFNKKYFFFLTVISILLLRIKTKKYFDKCKISPCDSPKLQITYYDIKK
jgi:hypothetical protein